MIIVTNQMSPYIETLRLERRHIPKFIIPFPLVFEYHLNGYKANSPVTGFAGKYVEALEIDIERVSPELILIEKTANCYACPENFTFFEFFDNIGFLEELEKHGYSRLAIQTNNFNVWKKTHVSIDTDAAR